MKIKPNEEQIAGATTKEEISEQSQRITWLVKNHFVKIASDGDNWTVLYQDPEDKRYWELYYPNSELHGGGPPALRRLSNSEAHSKYNV